MEEREVVADRNKTELTLRVTEAASNWLTSIGAKPIETEVPIQRGWVADLAGVWCPTRTEARNLKIVSRPKRFGYTPGLEPEEEERRKKIEDDSYRESENEYDALPDGIIIVHEVKTSRSDFMHDKKWLAPSPANMRVLSITPGIASQEEFPDGWWIICHGEDGKIKKIIQRGFITEISDRDKFLITLSIAERRHNRTLYSYQRELQQSQLNEKNTRINCERLSGCMKAVLSVAKAEFDNIEDCLNRYMSRRYYFGGRILNSYIMEELEDLYGKFKDKEVKG